MFVKRKAIVFYGGSAFEVSQKFTASSLAGAGERGSLGKRVSARPDWVGRSGRGESLLSRNADGCRNARVSGSGEVETECLHSRKRLFFISSNARGLYSGKRLRGTRAEPGYGQFREPGAERSHVVESAKPGKPPPAEPREARREGAGGAQRRATRSAAGRRDRPLDAKPAGGI